MNVCLDPPTQEARDERAEEYVMSMTVDWLTQQGLGHAAALSHFMFSAL